MMCSVCYVSLAVYCGTDACCPTSRSVGPTRILFPNPDISDVSLVRKADRQYLRFFESGGENP